MILETRKIDPVVAKPIVRTEEVLSFGRSNVLYSESAIVSNKS